MKYKFGFILIFLVFFQFPCIGQAPGFFMTQERKKQIIPFIASNSLIIVPVSVNGSVPLNFLVDTGVRSNLLFGRAIGDELGLQYSRKIKLMGADGVSELLASISSMNSLDLGKVKGVLQNILVLDDDFLELEALIGVPVYGIIGYDFFKNNPIKINYDTGLIHFYRTNALKRKPFLYRHLDLLIEEQKPYIQAKILQRDGSELSAKLLIDTGANHGLMLNRETSDQINLPPETLSTILGESLGGILYGQIGRVSSLSISTLSIKDVLTSYPDESLFSFIRKESGRQGSLGSEVLGRTRMVLDYPRNRILIRRGQNFYTPFEFDMSGIILKKTIENHPKYFVSGVREDSPAAWVGILESDEIISVNKIPGFLWEMSDLIKLFKSKNGNVIELKIRRYLEGFGGDRYQELKFQIVLQKQI